MSDHFAVDLQPDPRGANDVPDRLIGEAAESADPEWLVRAEVLAIEVANRGLPFSCNDIWEAGLDKPSAARGRALGRVVRSLAVDGWTHKVMKHDDPVMVKSKLGGVPIQVWQKT